MKPGKSFRRRGRVLRSAPASGRHRFAFSLCSGLALLFGAVSTSSLAAPRSSAAGGAAPSAASALSQAPARALPDEDSLIWSPPTWDDEFSPDSGRRPLADEGTDPGSDEEAGAGPGHPDKAGGPETEEGDAGEIEIEEGEGDSIGEGEADGSAPDDELPLAPAPGAPGPRPPVLAPPTPPSGERPPRLPPGGPGPGGAASEGPASGSGSGSGSVRSADIPPPAPGFPPGGGLLRLSPFKALPLPAALNRPVRVLLFEGRSRLTVEAADSADLEIRDAKGKTLVKAAFEGRFDVRRLGNKLELLQGKHSKSGPADVVLFFRPRGAEPLRLNGQPYRGAVEVLPEPASASEGRSALNSPASSAYPSDRGKFMVVNELPMEAYLQGVVPAEIGRQGIEALEALKAMAVVARTYAYKRMAGSSGAGRSLFGRRNGRAFDLYSDVRDQVYGGAGREYEAAGRAIRETRNMVVTQADTLIQGFYHSTCGGRTASIEEVWDRGPKPYLVSRPDTDGAGRAFCRFSPYFTWTESWPEAALFQVVARNQVQAGLGRRLDIARLDTLAVKARAACGRVKVLEVATDKGSLLVKGDKTRWLLRGRTVGGSGGDGMGRILPSAWFEIRRDGNRYVAEGRGFGHGVGMCQMGALERAKRGQDFAAIVTAYYTGTAVAELR